jgi:3-oxoacyl-[acyl-carrier protein] reductase
VSGPGVLVTGGTRGIGKGIAAAFLRVGADVVVTGRDEGVGAACARELNATAAVGSAGGSMHFLAADVATRDGCAAMAGAALKHLGRLDVLCANAGIFPDRPLTEMTEADVDDMLGVNVAGTIFSVQACIEPLTTSGRGRVVLTSSITGPVTGYPGWSHYGASKAAQLGFMRSAALELAPRGITVNAVLPGNIATEGLASLGADYEAAMRASIPLGRLGTVAEIGATVVFLASEDAGFITGQTIIVDGGQTLPETPSAILR